MTTKASNLYTGGLPALHESYPFISAEKYAGSLKGKVAIVTGVSAGIGRAVAKAFAAAGASTALVARREPELQTLLEEITAAGGHAISVPADVTAKGAAQRIVSKVEAELGPVDILVNNAGRARLSPLELEPEDLDIWWSIYELNVKAPVSLIRAVLPSMIQRKTGTLLTVSSGVATMRLPAMTAYASSKAAISKFHESLMPELKDTGVFACCMGPGMVKSEMGTAENAFNKAAMQHPSVQEFLSTIDPNHNFQDAKLPADTLVALAAEPRARVLMGLHVNGVQNLEAILEAMEKGVVEEKGLYRVKISAL